MPRRRAALPRRGDAGFSLVESLVALAVLAIASTALLVASQGYVRRIVGLEDRALAQIEARHYLTLDSGDSDRHELTADQATVDDPTERLPLEPTTSLPAWITRTALGAAPDDPVWRTNKLLFVDGLSPETILADSLASPEALNEAQVRMQALVANPQVMEAWEAASAY